MYTATLSDTTVIMPSSVEGPRFSSPSIYQIHSHTHKSRDEALAAEKWLREEGITAEDIKRTKDRLRVNGFPEHMLNDPGLIHQFLPRRNVVSVNIRTLTMAGKAPAGQPISFTLTGTLPDASFEFTRFVITRQDHIILIRPIGNSSGEIVPRAEIPITLRGELEPLPPGTFYIEFPELGPVGSYELIVE